MEDVILESQLSPATIQALTWDDEKVPAELLEKKTKDRKAVDSDRDVIVWYGDAQGSGKPLICHLQSDPLALGFYEGNELRTSVNSKGLLHFEHHRSRDGTPQIDNAKEEQDRRHGDKEVVGYVCMYMCVYCVCVYNMHECRSKEIKCGRSCHSSVLEMYP